MDLSDEISGQMFGFPVLSHSSLIHAVGMFNEYIDLIDPLPVHGDAKSLSQCVYYYARKRVSNKNGLKWRKLVILILLWISGVEKNPGPPKRNDKQHVPPGSKAGPSRDKERVSGHSQQPRGKSQHAPSGGAGTSNVILEIANQMRNEQQAAQGEIDGLKEKLRELRENSQAPPPPPPTFDDPIGRLLGNKREGFVFGEEDYYWDVVSALLYALLCCACFFLFHFSGLRYIITTVLVVFAVIFRSFLFKRNLSRKFKVSPVTYFGEPGSNAPGLEMGAHDIRPEWARIKEKHYACRLEAWKVVTNPTFFSKRIVDDQDRMLFVSTTLAYFVFSSRAVQSADKKMLFERIQMACSQYPSINIPAVIPFAPTHSVINDTARFVYALAMTQRDRDVDLGFLPAN